MSKPGRIRVHVRRCVTRSLRRMTAPERGHSGAFAESRLHSSIVKVHGREEPVGCSRLPLGRDPDGQLSHFTDSRCLRQGSRPRRAGAAELAGPTGGAV